MQDDRIGASERQGSVKDEARETLQAASESVKEEYRGLKEEAKQGVGEATHQAQERAHDYAEGQREVAGQGAEAIASALQAGVEPLREQGQDAIANYWAAAADGVGEFAERVKGKSVDGLWREAEQYVRQQPGVAFGGAMALGFVLSRFLKSSSGGYGGGEPSRSPSAGRSTASTFTGG